MNTTERFLRYIKVETTSSETSGTHPSSENQFELAKILVTDLLSLGIPKEDIFFDEEHCYIYAKIRSNTDLDVPKIGFIAHMDTSPEASGKDVRAQFVFDYEGDDIDNRINDVMKNGLKLIIIPTIIIVSVIIWGSSLFARIFTNNRS